MKKRLIAFVLLIFLSAAFLFGCYSDKSWYGDSRYNPKRFIGNYYFNALPDEEISYHNDFPVTLLSLNFSKFQWAVNPPDATWEPLSGYSYSISNLVELRTDGILYRDWKRDGEKITYTYGFIEKSIDQELIDDVNETIASIGKQFKLTNKKLIFKDTGKTYNISSYFNEGETLKRIEFEEYEFKYFFANYSYKGSDKVLHLVISNEVYISEEVKYTYTLYFGPIYKKYYKGEKK